MTTIKAGQVYKVTASGKLVPDEVFAAQGNDHKPFTAYPSSEQGDQVIIMDGFKAAGRSSGFVQVLHPKEGVVWMSTKHLEPME